MKACLDPEVSVLSPSLETRFLIGIALSAATGNFLSIDDTVDVSPMLVEGAVVDSLPITESMTKDFLDQLVTFMKDIELIDADVDIVIPFLDSLSLEAIGQVFLEVIKAAGLL